jgi:hypothetical protein
MFEGGGGAIRDISKRHDGTLTGTAWATERYGYALAMNGNTDYATVANQEDLNPGQISIAVLARSTHVTSGSWQEFIVLKSFTSHVAPYYQYGLGVAQGGVVTAALAIGGVYVYCGTATGVIAQNEWFSAVMTFDGSTFSVYVNGALSASVSTSGSINSYATAVYFGRYGNLPLIPDFCFDGDVVDVKIFDRALSANEATSLYQDPWSLYRQPEPVLANAPAGGFFQFDQLTGGMPDLRGGMV